jgi:ubiquinone/menaquinone biosynthesis C-methylase UbiE
MEKTQSLTEKPKGVMGADYHEERLKSLQLSYRYKRRGLEVVRIIRQHASPNPRILDLGTADGLTLDYVTTEIATPFATGLDRSWELLQRHSRKHPPIMADAEQIPLQSSSFDAVIATAIIEHVPNPPHFMQEIWRVLKSSGVCVISTPVPFFEEIASTLHLLPPEDHQETFNLKKLAKLVESQRFQVLEAEKFMMSPVGFPAELKIEKVMKKIGLGFVLLNQLVAARKIG